MFRSTIFIMLFMLSTTALAQTPIPRVGDDCPTGTYKSGDYCKPYKSSKGDSQTIITKSGSKCPPGSSPPGITANRSKDLINKPCPGSMAASAQLAGGNLVGIAYSKADDQPPHWARISWPVSHHGFVNRLEFLYMCAQV